MKITKAKLKQIIKEELDSEKQQIMRLLKEPDHVNQGTMMWDILYPDVPLKAELKGMLRNKNTVVDAIEPWRNLFPEDDLPLEDVGWQGADLQGVPLGRAPWSERSRRRPRANLQSADLRGANLMRANLQGANLMRANLQGADLQRAWLYSANLQRADLKGADLQGANLASTDLSGANLQEADLQGADLEGANLQRADLKGANLQEATDLRWANLRGANLRGANLRGAWLRGTKLMESIADDSTIWPEGLESYVKKAGVKFV